MTRMCKFLMQKKTKKKKKGHVFRVFCSLKRPILKQRGALKWKSYNNPTPDTLASREASVALHERR